MKEKKFIIIIITIISVLTSLIILNISTIKIDDKIAKHLENENFTLTENTRTYYKKISSTDKESYLKNIENKINSQTEYLYFNIDDYSLTNIIMEYKNDITRYFTGLYNYQEDALTYIYELTYENSYVTISGSYDILSKEYICKIDSYRNLDNPNNSKDTFCKKIKTDIIKFASTSTSLFNSNILDKMKKN